MSILDLLKEKEKITENVPLKDRKKDEHAFRSPIKCGLTIHPGYGCSLRCTYCYIYDMGLGDPVPSKLNRNSFLYSLSTNPYFLPRKTFLAIGSITEPFLPKIREKTVEFASAISELGNPTQISTKIPGKFAQDFLEKIPKASFLISVSDSLGKLEPKAPWPKVRISFADQLAESGYNVYIFLRPIIPGYTEKDEKLFEMLSKCEVKGVILGGLRVTERILKELSKKIDVMEILRRIKGEVRGRRQVSINVRDLKEEISQRLQEVGIKTMPLACAAMADAYSLGCFLCDYKCKGKMEIPNEREIREFLENFGREAEVKVEGETIKIFGRIGKVERELLMAYYRRRIREIR